MSNDLPPEHEILESIIAPPGESRPDWRLVRDVLASGYLAIGNGAPGFAAVTLAAAGVKFGLRFAVGMTGPPAGSVAATLRSLALSPLGWGALVSAIYGVAGVRWCRGIVLQTPRRTSPVGTSEYLFAIAFFVAIELVFASGRLTPLIEELLASSHPWLFLLYEFSEKPLCWIVEATLLFLIFPATAVGAARPFTQGLKLARGLYPELVAIYLLGFLPWWLVDFAGSILWSWKIGDPFAYNALLAQAMLGDILQFATLTCGIVLAATVYRHLVRTGDADGVATVFD